jgi:hypothetical protein
MRVVQMKRIGDRRVRLIVQPNEVYAVVIEVRGPKGFWEDISLRADEYLLAHQADARYQQRIGEQQARKSPNGRHQEA